MHVGYTLRRLPQQRCLVRNLMSRIIQLLKQSQRPMQDTEIISELSMRLHRSDPEFQRQVRLYLRDAASYGILKRQSNVFSLRSKRLGEILDHLVVRP